MLNPVGPHQRRAARGGSCWKRAHTCLLLPAGGTFAAATGDYRITNAWFAVPVLLALIAPNTVPPTDQWTDGGQHGQHGRK